jgi:hypothetical protein
MPSNNQRNNELEFTPTFGTQDIDLLIVVKGSIIVIAISIMDSRLKFF